MYLYLRSQLKLMIGFVFIDLIPIYRYQQLFEKCICCHALPFTGKQTYLIHAETKMKNLSFCRRKIKGR